MLIFVLKTQISQNLLRSGLIHFQTTSPRCECYPRTWIFFSYLAVYAKIKDFYTTHYNTYSMKGWKQAKDTIYCANFKQIVFSTSLVDIYLPLANAFFFFSVYLSWGLWFIKIQQRSAYQKLPFFYLASTIDLFNLTW